MKLVTKEQDKYETTYQNYLSSKRICVYVYMHKHVNSCKQTLVTFKVDQN
jgi:hypothetical protein